MYMSQEILTEEEINLIKEMEKTNNHGGFERMFHFCEEEKEEFSLERFLLSFSDVIEEYNKIPPEIIKAIEENMNEEYEYELDEDLELKNQPMLPETKAILFNLFRDYLATPEQKEKIIKMQNEERQKSELKKQQQYNANVFQNKTKENINQSKEMIEYKENIFVKLINKIKSWFVKK